jgi:predicted acylesterase/phospholipase RssA
MVGGFRRPGIAGAVRRAVLLAAVVSLTGCISVRPEGPKSEIAAVPFGAVTLFGDRGPIVDARAAGTDHLDILVLSGGGSHGAFGAGVLTGWTESGKRPQFDVVTGVSTGALMSVPAFLGSRYDDLLRRSYTNVQNADIYRERGLAGFLSTGLNDSNPLAGQIAAIVDEEVLAEVAAEYRKGRYLFVATTNLDSGQLVVWDMGKIAASDNPGRMVLFRSVLLASASIPGFFDPVYIASDGTVGGKIGQMHVDGGVKAPILLRSWMLNGKAPGKHVYVIVNGSLRLTATEGVVRPELVDISVRSIGELLRGLLYKTLYQAYVTTRRATSEFRLTYVPDDARETPATSFDPAAMREMFEIGRAVGVPGHKGWRTEPPRLEPLERI